MKNTHIKNGRGPQHKDLRAPILHMGGPLVLDFPGKNPHIKNFLGWDPNWGIFRVFLCVYVLFALLILDIFMEGLGPAISGFCSSRGSIFPALCPNQDVGKGG